MVERIEVDQLRSTYLITKALMWLEKTMDAVTDIRYREDSDLADIRQLLSSDPYRVFAQTMITIQEDSPLKSYKEI